MVMRFTFCLKEKTLELKPAFINAAKVGTGCAIASMIALSIMGALPAGIVTLGITIGALSSIPSFLISQKYEQGIITANNNSENIKDAAFYGFNQGALAALTASAIEDPLDPFKTEGRGNALFIGSVLAAGGAITAYLYEKGVFKAKIPKPVQPRPINHHSHMGF